MLVHVICYPVVAVISFVVGWRVALGGLITAIKQGKLDDHLAHCGLYRMGKRP